MKTLFDLREETNSETYEVIQNLFDESFKIIKLGDQSINACIGCWNCWLKTPGRCVMKDEMAESYVDYINSDTVILLIDTAQGFISHQAKAFFDRTIPHYNPYIEIVDGECHHVARYKKYPDLVFYFDRVGLKNQEEQVIEDYLYRVAYQFKSKAYRIDESLQLVQQQARKAKRAGVDIVSVEPMDKLVIYNGSPRKSGSNSAIILKQVTQVLGNRVEIRDLKEKDKWEMWADTFESDEHVMFFVQSGFPESSQSHYLEVDLTQ